MKKIGLFTQIGDKFGTVGAIVATMGCAMKIGERLHLGENVVLEITQIGKKCHNDGCVIKKATGDCIMPKEGLFARVIRGGVLTKGDTIRKPVPVIS